MNIDWSKAPEGATHHAIGDWVYKWFKKIDEDTLYFWLGESWLRGVGTPAQTFAFYGVGNIVSRPAEWTGEGLPPIGTACEYKWRGEWHRGTVAARVQSLSNRQEVIVQLDGDWTYDHRSSHFRPTEQIAAEDRAKDLSELVDIIDGADAADKTIAQAIYDAGYRKQVQP